MFERGSAVPCASIAAGQIGKLWGLGDVQIGDTLGVAQAGADNHYFAPPTLETVVVPRLRTHNVPLHAALVQLAEQDPLINLRQDETGQEMFLSLYGEVQKEVIQATLLNEFNLDVEFRETTTICVERPIGAGEAVEYLGKAPNPFPATIGLRIEPAPIDTGIVVRLAVDVRTIPLYVFKTVEEFRLAIEEAIQHTLRQGIYGWQVNDCIVTVTQSGYTSPSTKAWHVRRLTPLVLAGALKAADTVVCEPIQRFHLEIPAESFSAALAILIPLRAAIAVQERRATSYSLEGTIPAARVHDLQQRLPGLTRGEGVLETTFAGYQPASTPFPTRARTGNNPLNRKEYLLHLTRRA
jgi:ribosomal protection tetracycline resistance protein